MVKAIKDGSMTEVFGTGTAAVISPIGEISHKGESLMINDGKIGKISQRLYDEIYWNTIWYKA